LFENLLIAFQSFGPVIKQAFFAKNLSILKMKFLPQLFSCSFAATWDTRFNPSWNLNFWWQEEGNYTSTLEDGAWVEEFFCKTKPIFEFRCTGESVCHKVLHAKNAHCTRVSTNEGVKVREHYGCFNAVWSNDTTDGVLEALYDEFINDRPFMLEESVPESHRLILPEKGFCPQTGNDVCESLDAVPFFHPSCYRTSELQKGTYTLSYQSFFSPESQIESKALRPRGGV
jgi:hypothetical protein